MTTITLPRAVVEQALEALVSENSLSAVAMQQRMDALRALKTALAQQAEPVEPVAWMHNILEDNIIRHRPADLKRSPQNWTPLCNCAQPQQSDTDCHTQGICQRSGYDITQQAEPVEPVALTDEEILSVLRLAPPEPSLWPHLKDEAVVGDVQRAVLAIARAVEAAHGIGRQTDPQIEDRLARHGIPKP
jgi:hypothetical protein